VTPEAAHATAPAGPAAAAADAIGEAMRRRDFSALILAEGVMVASPITSSFVFEGRDEVLALLGEVREAFEDYEYLGAIREGDAAALHFRARVRGQSLEGLDLVRVDPTGAITEIRVFARPLPAVAGLMRELGPRVARPHGRWRSAAMRMLTGPLALVTRRGDRLGARLAGRRPQRD